MRYPNYNILQWVLLDLLLDLLRGKNSTGVCALCLGYNGPSSCGGYIMQNSELRLTELSHCAG